MNETIFFLVGVDNYVYLCTPIAVKATTMLGLIVEFKDN